MDKRKRAPSNLEVLIQAGVLQEGITPDEAADSLTDILNCAECIALNECADCYGKFTGDEEPECRRVVMEYLRQDYKQKGEKKE